MPAII